MDAPSIDGVGHIDLTVRDAESSSQWWEKVLGFKLVNVHEEHGRKGYGMVHPCGLPVVLLEHPHTTTERFDEQSIGLDHLAFRVPDRETLEAWASHLDTLGVAHSGIQEENGGPLIVFRDPDNIQLEVWAFDWDQVTTNRRVMRGLRVDVPFEIARFRSARSRTPNRQLCARCLRTRLLVCTGHTVMLPLRRHPAKEPQSWSLAPTVRSTPARAMESTRLGQRRQDGGEDVRADHGQQDPFRHAPMIAATAFGAKRHRMPESERLGERGTGRSGAAGHPQAQGVTSECQR